MFIILLFRLPDELTRMFDPVLNLSDIFNNLDSGDGQLKVYLRVRPILPHEVGEAEDELVKILDQHTVVLTAPASSNTFKNSTHGITKLTHR